MRARRDRSTQRERNMAGRRALPVQALALAFVFLLCGSRVPVAADGAGILVEAEAFDNIVRYPFWDSDVGRWYALESITYVRGTREGYVACIHKGSTGLMMTRTLSAPVAAGSYHVFLKVFRCRWRPEPNVVELQIGEVAHEFRWQEEGGWLGPVRYDLAAPARQMRLTAVHFGGASFGLLQESRERAILIDTLYITTDLDERPTEDGTAFEKAQARVPGRTSLTASWRFAAASAAKAATRDADVDAGQRNLLHNSSFELGINDGWACYCSARDGYILSEDDLDTSTAAHGKRSLCLPATGRPFSKLLSLKQADQLTFSAYLRATSAMKVTLAVSAPTDRTPKPVVSQEFEVTEEWQRFSVSGPIEAGHYCVGITPQGEGAYWIDALQLEYGPPTDYRPRRPVEGALTSGRYANIVYDDETVPLLRIYNDDGQAHTVSLRYRVVDVWERVIAEGATPPQTVAPHDTAEERLDLGLTRRGIFSLTYALEDIDSPDGETLLCIIPRPDGGRHRHELAANMDFAPHVMRAMQRAGYRWELYCKIHFTYSNRCQPEPGQFVWDDEAMDLAARHGYDIVPCFFPFRCPEWMDDPDYAMEHPRQFTRHSEARYPKLDLFAEHVEQVVAHYKGWVKYWWMDDEVEGHVAPRDYGRFLNATIPAVKEADQAAQVGISATPDYTEELLEYVDPDLIDVFGGSTYGGRGWQARKIRHLCQRYGKEWFIIGVGRDKQPSFYHTAPDYRKALGGAMGTAQHMIGMALAQDAKAIGHYTGRLTNFGGHRTFDCPLMDYDGTLLPHGLTYTCLVHLLADAVPFRGVELEALGTSAYVFELHGRVGAALWGRPNGVHFPLTADEVEPLDMYFNPLPEAAFDVEGLTFDLTLAPMFLLARGLDRDEFVTRLQRVRAPASSPLDLRLSFVIDDGQQVALGITVGNASEEQAEGIRLTLSQRSLYGVHPAWFLKSWEATIDRVGSGGEGTAQLPVVPRALSNPIENVRLRVAAEAGSLGSASSTDELYLLPSPALSRAPVLDGDLSEWKGRSAAWIFTCWGWSRIARGIEQIEAGGEFVSYAGSGDNGVAMWSGWDPQALHLAFEVFDDDLRFDGDLRDELEVVIGPGPHTLTLRCDPDHRAQALLDGSSIPDVACQVSQPRKIPGRSGRHGRCTFEVAIPWSSLGVANPGSLTLLAFDVRQRDVDDEGVGLRQAVLRWAGGRPSPGQLLLSGTN